MAERKEEAQDSCEARLQETVPDSEKLASLPTTTDAGRDTGFHVDKPISVTEAGYGGVSGRGNDISKAVQAARDEAHRTAALVDHCNAAEISCLMADSSNAEPPSTISTEPIEGPHHHHHHTNKEGIMSKVMDKFHLGSHPHAEGGVEH